MFLMKKIIACVLAICTVFCGTAMVSSGYGKNAEASYTSSIELIELQNGMTFGRRVISGYIKEDELTLVSYTGTAENVIIPQSVDGMTVTGIEDEVFRDNTNIRSVTIPDTVSYFGKYLFQDSTLRSINIPKKLKIIPDFTFFRCSKLENVEFHDDIILIGKTAFQGTDIHVPEKLMVNEVEGKIYDSDKVLTMTVDDWTFLLEVDPETAERYAKIVTYSGRSSDLIFPDNCIGIPVVGIDSVRQLQSILITSLVVPASFSWSPGLYGHTELKSITFLGDSISVGALFETGIEELDLPVVKSMDIQALADNAYLRKVTFKNTSDHLDISIRAFQNCTALEEVIIPENCESVSIDKNAFENCGLKKLELYGNIDVNTYAFRNCGELTYAAFSGDTALSSYSFRDCKSLKEIVFGGDVQLDYNVFNGCKAVESIILDTTRTINGAAFNGCADLMNIGSEPAFDSKTGDFRADIKDFILTSFNAADDVGFINQYVKSQAEKVVREYTDDSMSDMQKIKILHDWVCNNTVYNHDDVNAPESHNDAALFMNDTAVCESYTKALNLLLNAAGIETYYVHSSDHAWNVVKLGGHYFHVDTTWDDGDTISYDWFLKSDSELKAAGGSHEKWSLFTPSSLHSFQGSVLPECEYQMGDLNTDGSVDGGDLRLLQDYILGKAPVSADDIVLADLNHDGVTDVFDLISMRRLINEN